MSSIYSFLSHYNLRIICAYNWICTYIPFIRLCVCVCACACVCTRYWGLQQVNLCVYFFCKRNKFYALTETTNALCVNNPVVYIFFWIFPLPLPSSLLSSSLLDTASKINVNHCKHVWTQFIFYCLRRNICTIHLLRRYLFKNNCLDLCIYL